jgi:hypothetical protein
MRDHVENPREALKARVRKWTRASAVICKSLNLPGKKSSLFRCWVRIWHSQTLWASWW